MTLFLCLSLHLFISYIKYYNTALTIQYVPEALSLGVKRPGRETGHSPPSSAEVKEWVEPYLQSPNTPSWCGTQLKHRDNFTFNFNKRDNKLKFVLLTYFLLYMKMATLNTLILISF